MNRFGTLRVENMGLNVEPMQRPGCEAAVGRGGYFGRIFASDWPSWENLPDDRSFVFSTPSMEMKMSGHDAKVLNTLIATTIDSADGFDEAAAHTRAPVLSSQFRDCARERREVVAQLQAEVRRSGETPVEEGTTKATVHRRWLDLKNAVTGSDKAVLQEVENGETYLRAKYEAALEDQALSEPSRRAIEEAFTAVQRVQDRVIGLRPLASDEPWRPMGNVSWSKLGIGLGAAAVAIAATRLISSSRARNTRYAFPLDTDENMRLISSRKVEGTHVVGRDGERLGTIDSFMVDKYSGRVAYAIMSYGGVMGVGSHLIPLPWSSLTYDVEADGYVVNLTKEDLAEAPRFEASAEPEFDETYRQRILVFYRPARGSFGRDASMRGAGAARTGGGVGSGAEERAASARSRRGSAGDQPEDESRARGVAGWEEAEPANRMAARGTENRPGGFNAPGGSSGGFGGETGKD